jgi:hypothetical protein
VRRLAVAASVVALLGTAGEADVIPESPSALEIVERAHGNWTRYDTSATIRIEVVSRSGRRMERKLEAFRLRVGGQPRTLIRMTYPPDLRGTTLLVLENGRGDDDRFLYLPVSRRVRRISAGQRGDRVLGTDFSYEDLGAGDLDDFRHERLSNASVDGIDCFVVRTEERNPGPGSLRRTSWISRNEFVPLRVEYERHGRLSRRLEADPTSLAELGPGAWLPRRIVMRDLIRGTRTELDVQKLDTRPSLDPDQLSLTHLQSLSRRSNLTGDDAGETGAAEGDDPAEPPSASGSRPGLSP